MNEREQPSNLWAPLREYIIHTLVGVTIFAVIALLAIGMNLLRNYLQLAEISPFISTALTSFEYLLFALDIVLALVFMATSTFRFVRKTFELERRAKK